MAAASSDSGQHVAWGRLEQLNAIFFGKVREVFCDPGSFILTLERDGWFAGSRRDACFSWFRLDLGQPVPVHGRTNATGPTREC